MNPTIAPETITNRRLAMCFLIDDQLALALAMSDYASHLLFESKDETNNRAGHALKVAMENLEISVKKYTDLTVTES